MKKLAFDNKPVYKIIIIYLILITLSGVPFAVSWAFTQGEDWRFITLIALSVAMFATGVLGLCWEIMKTIYVVLTQFWQLLNRDVTLRLKFWNPSRKEYLEDKIDTILEEKLTVTNYDSMMATVEALTNNDFAIFSQKGNQRQFVQCIVDDGNIIVNLIIHKEDLDRDRRKNRIEKILKSFQLKNASKFNQHSVNNPKLYFYEVEEEEFGLSYLINFRTNRELATQCMLEALHLLYTLPPNFELETLIDSGKRIWF